MGKGERVRWLHGPGWLVKITAAKEPGAVGRHRCSLLSDHELLSSESTTLVALGKEEFAIAENVRLFFSSMSFSSRK
ncbi:hypothetical protein LIER_11913 [Lithospermum erythrorhizon]|uniref:Uncharacterized protein n=1 Tax=Lithospermum erythrorhizon TaxID=34254 RepID=A0AAV3PUX9_LITER